MSNIQQGMSEYEGRNRISNDQHGISNDEGRKDV